MADKSADLSVSKVASPNNVNIGQSVTYTITVKNNGPDDATEVILTDSIPPSTCLSAIAISPQQGTYTYSSNIIRWEIGNLTKNTSATLTATVIPQASGAFTNYASVSAKEDQNPDNNTGTAIITVVGSPSPPTADLAICKISCPSDVLAGSLVTYYLCVINNGPAEATNVIVDDTLPPQLTPESAIVTPIGKGLCTINGQNVNCQLGNMAPNERVLIIITAIPQDTGTFQNTAYVNSAVQDPNYENNVDSATTVVQPAANLTITKIASSEAVVLGETLTYTIQVINNGPSAATAVMVTDSLPPNMTVISTETSQGSGCTPIGNNQYLCSLDTIPNGGTAKITIAAKPTASGCITNSATVKSDTPNLNPCNTATTCTLVKPTSEADIAVTKSHIPEQIAVCTPVTYTITVTNNGPFPATGVILVDQLPSSVEVLSICLSQGYYCTRCRNEIVFHIGALAVGSHATIQITMKPCQIGTITNTAIVTANEEDLNPANNQAIDTVTVVTISAQIQYLIDEINALVTSGLISQQDADCLILYLQTAKQALSCCNLQESCHALEFFIERINYYINQNMLPSDAGCPLAKIAEAIRQCLCCTQPRLETEMS